MKNRTRFISVGRYGKKNDERKTVVIGVFLEHVLNVFDPCISFYHK